MLECYHVTGEFDYLLKIVVRNRKELQRFVEHELTPIPGVARIYTSLVLDEIKHSTALPIVIVSKLSCLNCPIYAMRKELSG